MTSSWVWKWLCVLSIVIGIFGRKYKLTLRMPDITQRATSETEENSSCTYKEIPNKDLFATAFAPVAYKETAVRMLLFGCSRPKDFRPSWDCIGDAVCEESDAKIMYTWAKNTSALSIPDGAAFHVGGDSVISFFVLQVHYAPSIAVGETGNPGIEIRLTTMRPGHLAGTYTFSAGSPPTPPKAADYHVDVECTYKGHLELVPFAFRTQTRGLGYILSTYRIRNDVWKLIGKGSPQVPQVFYPTSSQRQDPVKHGDVLVSRCTYSSPSLKKAVYSGAFSGGEICSFDLMYYAKTLPPVGDAFISEDMDCSAPPPVARKFPSDSEVIPDFQQVFFENLLKHELSASKPERVEAAAPKSVDFPEPPLTPASSGAPTLSTASGGREKTEVGVPVPVEDPSWPSKLLLGDDQPLGEVTGLAFDKDGRLVVFHRAGRVWKESSFDEDHNFLDGDGPITFPTVLHVDPLSGKVVEQWGSDIFWLPHGLTVDQRGNMWFTDIALHQVFKFEPGRLNAPALTLGESHRPGSDDRHFCQPTSVAVLSSGVFYVADGYCNSRIMKFSPEGSLLKKWGYESSKDGPHGAIGVTVPQSLAVDEAEQVLYVLDKDKARIIKYDWNGGLLSIISNAVFGERLSAMSFGCNREYLYALSGQSSEIQTQPTGFVIRKDGGDVYTWRPSTDSMHDPHAMVYSPNCGSIYVGDYNPPKVWRFQLIVMKNGSLMPENVTHIITSPSKDGRKKRTDRINPSLVPAIVIVAVLASPVVLMCFVAVVQNIRVNHGVRKALKERDKAVLGNSRTTSCCCWRRTIYYGRYKNGFTLVNEGDSDDEEDDIYSAKPAARDMVG